MKYEIAEQWAAALRSDEYKQGYGQLRNNDKFCCLGVLCNLHAQAHPNIAARQKYSNRYISQAYELPPEVVNWAGMSSNLGRYVLNPNDPRTLALDNDHHKKPFDQLADIIERNWDRL